MFDTLTAQYEMVKSARGVLLTCCSGIRAGELSKPVPEFNNSSINSLLLHTANTYVHWLVKIAQRQPYDFFDERSIGGLADIESIFATVDQLVAGFLLKFGDCLDVALDFEHPAKNIKLTLKPVELFTHVVTHEFHHKGQILSMSRLLGYTPVDTDIIRT